VSLLLFAVTAVRGSQGEKQEVAAELQKAASPCCVQCLATYLFLSFLMLRRWRRTQVLALVVEVRLGEEGQEEVGGGKEVRDVLQLRACHPRQRPQLELLLLLAALRPLVVVVVVRVVLVAIVAFER
jgi:hypothetical protein